VPAAHGRARAGWASPSRSCSARVQPWSGLDLWTSAQFRAPTRGFIGDRIGWVMFLYRAMPIIGWTYFIGRWS
jgi:hypothetical protein